MKPYLRFYSLPEEKTSVAQIRDLSEVATAQFLALELDGSESLFRTNLTKFSESSPKNYRDVNYSYKGESKMKYTFKSGGF